jgi:hypothetical protein
MFALPASGAERFDNITVALQAMHMGETHHGYNEIRVLVENRSVSRSHRVTLTFPEQAHGAGNSIRRVQRSVSLGPGSRIVVPLFQPPLRAYGNGRIGVAVDGRFAGTVPAPNANRHASHHHHAHHHPQPTVTVLSGRGINPEEFLRFVQGTSLSAIMATGAPDSGGGVGSTGAFWMPDPSARGPHWIELDYEKPAPIDRVRVFEHQKLPASSGEIILLNPAGQMLARVIKPPRSPGAHKSSWVEASFPLTSEPVKTVRLEFPGGGAPVGIDAVQVLGPHGEAWASDARASSSSPAGSLGHASASMLARYGLAGSAGSFNVIRSELATGEWSEHWLAYTPYDAIALTVQEWESVPPTIRAALWRYAECGGTLFIFGKTDIPEPWRSFAQSGFTGGTSFGVGFGHFFVFDEQGLPSRHGASRQTEKGQERKASRATEMTRGAEMTARFWRELPRDHFANAVFPVVEEAGLPVRGIIFIMLGFIVLIGPVNLIVLARLKRRTWMLWTIPAISVLTCGALFSYMMVREGFTADMRLESVTLLDQVNHRASSFGVAAYYCPLTPNQGLSYSHQTEVTPLVSAGDRSGSGREIDWTESQHLRRGWIEARVPAHFLLRKSETRRERLEIEGTPDQPEIVNGLGAHIRKLWLADRSGRVFSASDIAPGRKVALASGSEQVSAPESPRTLHALFHQVAIGSHSETLESAGVGYLAPGSYLAELEESPFLERGLYVKSARIQQRSWVYGILAPSNSP